MRPLLLSLVAAALLRAADAVPAEVPPPLLELFQSSAAPESAVSDDPGRAKPVAPAPAGALVLRWGEGLPGAEEQTSLLVVGAGVGLLRPAWLLTWEKPLEGTGDALLLQGWSVAYTGKAFLDAAGRLHLDARHSPVSGPRATNWSPDSFRVAPDGSVASRDDQERGRINPGRQTGRIDPADPAKLPLYRAFLAFAQAACDGGL